MGDVIKAFFGGGSPKTSTVSSDKIKDDAKKAKRAKAQVLATQEGIVGEDLQETQVKTKNTTFGN